MRIRPGQTNTAAIVVASIFALMFIGTVTFFVYQFQKGNSAKKPTTNTKVTNKNANKNKNSNTANANTNTAVTVDLSPMTDIPDTWKYYINASTNYSLRYPATWTLQEVSVPEHPVQKIPVRYIQLTNPNGQVTLTLGVRRVGDVVGLSERTKAPTGTLKTGLKLTIGTTTVTTTNLVVDGKVPAIFYHPLNPFGYTYVDGREVQAELDLSMTPGMANPLSDLLAATDTQIANTILTTLTFSDSSTPLTPPPTPAAPLGQYKIETYKATSQALPDTRLINLDGGKRTVVIDSTRARAGLASGHSLMPFALPAFGTTLYFQDIQMKSGAVGGAIWTYSVTTKQLTKQATYPTVGWGKVVLNSVRTRAVYVSSVDSNDSGLVTQLYYLDLINNSLSTLITLRDNQTFSAGWGGTTNSYNFSFRTDDTVQYTFYDQNSGNKQSRQAKSKLGSGQVVVPGANPATK